MSAVKENVGTFILNNEVITLVEENGVRSVSLLLQSGTVTVKGTQKLITGSNTLRSDDPIVLISGTPLNLSFIFAIDGLIIDSSAGSVLMITGR